MLRRGVTVVALSSRMSAPGRIHTSFSSVFDSFFVEQHDTSDAAGEGGRGVATCWSRAGAVSSSSRRSFTWNHALGATSVTRAGHVRVDKRPRTKVERFCTQSLGLGG